MLVLPLVAQLLTTALSASSLTRDTVLSHSTIAPIDVVGSAKSVSFRYGKISGRVVNASQAPVAGALISIDVIAGGRVTSAWVTTDANGRFARDSLLPGMRYVIEANCIGYKTTISETVVAAADVALTVELVMPVLSPNIAATERGHLIVRMH
jgi:hypothetical protein